MLSYILLHWPDILLLSVFFFLSVIPVIPPTFAGLNKTYFNTYYQKECKQNNLNLIGLIVHLISGLIITGPALSMSFKGTVTLILFVVLITDLVFNKTITNNGIIISVIAIIALYFENMLEKAGEISIGKIFYYKSKNLYSIYNKEVPKSQK